MNMVDSNNSSLFNSNFVELDLVNNQLLNYDDGTNALIIDPEPTSVSFINENHSAISSKLQNANDHNKFNSFPMRKHKQVNSSSNVKVKSSSSIGYRHLNLTMLSQDELNTNVKLAKQRSQESDRLKHFLRSNVWPAKHPIRKYLWKTLLQLSTPSSSSTTTNNFNNNKENHSKHSNKNGSSNNINKIDFTNNESDYNRCLNQIFGKTRDIEVSMPDFVNNSLIMTSSSSSGTSSNNLSTNYSTHLNYYYLNEKGKQAIKRILCVYEYHFPHVTFSPALVSISSVLLHYLQEHEVFAALCFMSSTKDHLIESKASWDVSCSVFIRLLKNYCKSSYDIISKYATESIELIYSEWYWWIFDCLSFDHLVKIMDCYLYEGQKVLYRVSLAIVQQFSKYIEFIEDCEYLNELFIDVVKSENLKVNKDSIKQFCETASNIESIEKLLKISFSIRNLKRSTIREFFLKEEMKRKHLNDHSSPIEHSKPALSKIDENKLSDHSPTRVFLHETSTNILTHAHLCTIWSWIPQRLTVYSPNMLFTTYEHGTSFNTLYNVLDNLEYCLLIIKTFQNEIFGAFCSCHWTDRRHKTIYFGNGETFLFKLAPEKKIFKWIGTRNQKPEPNQEMFIRADNTKIAIGGGGRDGLCIFSNLIEGTSNTCDTFENEPLSSVEHFQIAILEVISFEI